MKKKLNPKYSLKYSKVTSLTLVAAALCMYHGCSNGPKQYNPGSPPNVGNQAGRLANVDDFLAPSDAPAGRDESQIARDNAMKPIIYGVGAGGITLKTTLAESRILLQKSAGSNKDTSTVQSFYNDSLVIAWHKSEPQTPLYIIASTGYNGALTIDAGAATLDPDLRNLTPTQSLEKFFTKEDPHGDKLFVQLYNALEKKTDPTYNCLVAKTCTRQLLAGYIIVDFPKMEILIASDRKTIFRLVMQDSVPHGPMDSNFDLITGRFDGSDGKTIAVGQTWKDVNETMAKYPVYTTPRSNALSQDYTGIDLAFTKSQSGREYTKPADSETLKGITISKNYGVNKFKIDGKFIRMNYGTPPQAPLTLELADNAEDDNTSLDQVDEPAKYLRLTSQIPAPLQASFAKQITKLLSDSIKKADPQAKVSTAISGFNTSLQNKSFGIEVLGVIPSTGTVKDIEFSLDQSSGNFNQVYSQVAQHPVEFAVANSMLSPITLPDSGNAAELAQFAGFKLGSKVVLTDIDKARGEATLTYPLDPTKPGTSSIRVDYGYKNNLVRRAYSTMQVDLVSESTVTISSLNVVLGLDDGSNIISVSAPALGNPLTGLCDAKNLEISFAMSKDSILSAMEKTLKTDGDSTCYLTDSSRWIQIPGTTMTSEQSMIHFPNNQVALEFSQGDLTAVTVYVRSRGKSL